MFTISQLSAAHAKVKSGADFPGYIQDIIKLGVESYETFVADGHTVYHGKNGFNISTNAKYAPLAIADKSNQIQFQQDLKAHQQGQSVYLTFCDQSANAGVEKWIVDTKKMTCAYYDKAGHEMLVEIIPAP